MRSLKDIYPEYADKVDFYAVTIDPTAGLEELEFYAWQNELTFPIVDAGSRMLPALWIRQMSSKLAFDADGIIVYRKEYGSGYPEEYRNVLAELAASTDASSVQ